MFCFFQEKTSTQGFHDKNHGWTDHIAGISGRGGSGRFPSHWIWGGIPVAWGRDVVEKVCDDQKFGGMTNNDHCCFIKPSISKNLSIYQDSGLEKYIMRCSYFYGCWHPTFIPFTATNLFTGYIFHYYTDHIWSTSYSGLIPSYRKIAIEIFAPLWLLHFGLLLPVKASGSRTPQR